MSGNVGPIFTSDTISPVDIEAPGKGTITLKQISNSHLESKITLPTTDADGSPITGLKKVRYGIVSNVDGFNPVADVPSFNEFATQVRESDVDESTQSIVVLWDVTEFGTGVTAVAYCTD